MKIEPVELAGLELEETVKLELPPSRMTCEEIKEEMERLADIEELMSDRYNDLVRERFLHRGMADERLTQRMIDIRCIQAKAIRANRHYLRPLLVG